MTVTHPIGVGARTATATSSRSTTSRWSTTASFSCSRAFRSSVPDGGIVALLGANGAGKTTTLKAISNLLHSERGEVTKGAILFDGAEVQGLSPNEVVRRGCIQVMQGRYCFGHLTIEENLLTGAFTRRDGGAAIRADLEKVYAYFPRLQRAPRRRWPATPPAASSRCARSAAR